MSTTTTAAIIAGATLAALTPCALGQASKVRDIAPRQPPPLAVSPDGRYIAEMGFPNLVIRDLGTGEARRLTRSQFPQAVSSAVFSPDGRQIAYGWQNDEGFVDLRIVEIENSEPRVLHRDSTMRYLSAKAWSPDAQYILIVALRTDSSGQIALVSTADGSLRELSSLEVRPRLQLTSSPVRGESPGTMAFSPDGDFIAYDVSVGRNRPDHDIRIVALDGDAQGSLVEGTSDDRLLGWEPDGRGIVFASDRSGSVDVWLLPMVDGALRGEPELLAGGVGQLLPLGFARDGSYYYAVRRGTCDLYTVPLDLESGDLMGQPLRLGPAFHTGGVDWSPDGTRPAYVAPAGGTSAHSWTLSVLPVATGARQDLPVDVPILHQLRPQWSPDGRYLLAKGWDPAAPPGELVYRVDVETGVRTTLFSTPSLWERMIDWVSWAGDATAVAYVVPPDALIGTARVMRMDLQSGEERELISVTTLPFLYAMNVSPDGRHLALGLWDQKEQTATLKIVSASGESRAFTGAFAPAIWHRDSERLLYQAGDLWQASLGGGQPRNLGRVALPEGLEIAAASVHPVGTAVALIAAEPFRYEVWVMRNVGRPAGQ